MEKYKVVVYNNETGEVMQEAEGNCFLGAVTSKGGSSAVFSVMETNAVGVAFTTTALERLIKQKLKENKAVAALHEIMVTLKKPGSATETVE